MFFYYLQLRIIIIIYVLNVNSAVFWPSFLLPNVNQAWYKTVNILKIETAIVSLHV